MEHGSDAVVDRIIALWLFKKANEAVMGRMSYTGIAIEACRRGRFDYVKKIYDYFHPRVLRLSDILDIPRLFRVACNNGWDDIASELLGFPYVLKGVLITPGRLETCIIDVCEYNMTQTAEILASADGAYVSEYVTRTITRMLLNRTIMYFLPLTECSINDNHLFIDNSAEKALCEVLIQKELTKRLDEISDVLDIGERLKHVEELKKAEREIGSSRDCMTCCESTDHNIMYNGCNHVIPTCETCTAKMERTCPMCRRDEGFVKNIHVI